jgi:PRTRC genetic system protein B
MNDITRIFDRVYVPKKALLIYTCHAQQEHSGYNGESCETYVESYDIGLAGKPINAHPLTLKESMALAQLLESGSDMQNGFLRPRDLLSTHVLHVNPHGEGYAVWYTPPKEQSLFFTSNLGIDCGKGYVPALLWKATCTQLQVFALKGKGRPSLSVKLYHAPFFNIDDRGKVCMGTVNVDIDRSTRLEDFMKQWEQYFFNSYFSHGIDGGGGTACNIVQLWQHQVATNERFPESALKPVSLTLKQLLQ